MAATSAAAIRQAVQRIIDADLSVEEIRCAVMSLIPVEYHRRHADIRSHGWR